MDEPHAYCNCEGVTHVSPEVMAQLNAALDEPPKVLPGLLAMIEKARADGRRVYATADDMFADLLDDEDDHG